MAFDESELESLMSNANIGERAKRKMRAANKPRETEEKTAPEPRPRPRGHGPAQITIPVINDL